MKYLDYVRLSADGVDPVLRAFLVKVCQTDSIRRAQTAFPEFFSNQPSRTRVRRSDIRNRSAALEAVGDVDNPIMAALEWFGIPVYEFESREGGEVTDSATRVLPSDFPLKHGGDYNGLVNEPWIVDLPTTSGKKVEEHLVLDILDLRDTRGKEDPLFFIWTTPAQYILVHEDALDE